VVRGCGVRGGSNAWTRLFSITTCRTNDDAQREATAPRTPLKSISLVAVSIAFELGFHKVGKALSRRSTGICLLSRDRNTRNHTERYVKPTAGE